MTAQEKAFNLFNKYFSEIRLPSDCEGCMQCVDRCGNMVAIAKKYALIAVDEIINESEENDVDDFYSDQGYYIDNLTYKVLGYNEYWQEVKQEIEKL